MDFELLESLLDRLNDLYEGSGDDDLLEEIECFEELLWSLQVGAK